MACLPDYDGSDGAAVREVAQVYESIKLQLPVLLHYSSPPSSTAQLAHNLLGDALRALNVALSVMNHHQQRPAALAAAAAAAGPVATPAVKAEPRLPAADSQATAATRTKRRRSSSAMEGTAKQPSSSSWVDHTTVPYEDGYEWRKYGEKKINGAGHTRSYFRCTYRDDAGCQATKHVQQRDDGGGGDPPVFQVTYNNKHTCSSSHRRRRDCAAATSSGGGAMVVKQEPPAVAVLPPPDLVQVSVAIPNFDEQTPLCQEELLFPAVSMQRFCGAVGECHRRHGGVPPSTSTTASSCISGESSDEYSVGEDVARAAEVQASSAGDVPSCDFELFLLCNSFKDY